MFKLNIQVAKPDGTFRSLQLWTQARDETDASKQITDRLTKDGYKWFKITSITKM